MLYAYAPVYRELQHMARIEDFNENELWIIQTTLQERYGEQREIQMGDSEIRLHSADRDLTTCPIIMWDDDTCHFVILKCGDNRYRCLFYYRSFEQFGTGVEEFDQLAECIVTLLQTEADKARETEQEQQTD